MAKTDKELDEHVLMAMSECIDKLRAIADDLALIQSHLSEYVIFSRKGLDRKNKKG